MTTDETKNPIDASANSAESLLVEAQVSETGEGQSVEARAEEQAKEENKRYLEKECDGAKALLDEKKVEALLEVVQSWPEDWEEQVGQKKEDMKKQAIEALGLEDQDEGTQNMILQAVAEVLKENPVASKLSPPPAGTFLKGIQDQLDLVKNRNILNWKSWYEDTEEGRKRWQEILVEVK